MCRCNSAKRQNITTTNRSLSRPNITSPSPNPVIQPSIPLSLTAPVNPNTIKDRATIQKIQREAIRKALGR